MPGSLAEASSPGSYRPRVLVIAGSDSSGGAGIEADQRVLALHSCYVLTVTTALTAQNTQGVTAIHATPPAFITQTLTTLWNDIPGIDVVKIGMLANTSTVSAVAGFLAAKKAEIETEGRRRQLHIVLDPVMRATSGAELLVGPDDAVRALREELLPLASIVTPNIPEALLLAGRRDQPETTDDLVDLARKTLRLCGRDAWVLVKGGHFNQASGRQDITDLLLHASSGDGSDGSGEELHILRKTHISSRNTHGTGCSLASAIAAHLAHGRPPLEAVMRASRYVGAGIRSARGWRLGSEGGYGPIDHWAGIEGMHSGME